MYARTTAAARPRTGAVATKRHAATVRSTTVFTMRRQPVCFIVVDLESAGPNMTPRWVWHQDSCLSPLGCPDLFICNHRETSLHSGRTQILTDHLGERRVTEVIMY